jgi:hypothetical protein
MPRGPKGEKRPADVIGSAIMVGRIATGEVDDSVETNRVPGKKAGGEARARSLSAGERSKIASKAAKTRWNSE